MVPDHGWVERETLYDASGAVFSVSAWGDFTKVTQTLARDAFGRPTHVRPPEGSAHDVFYTYMGDRRQEATTYVATSETAESQVGRRVIRDSFGRLDNVRDLGLISGLNQITYYRYNGSGTLGKLHSKAADTNVLQAREFIYDHRGFLLREKHPEKGPSGNGSVFYYDYDPSGKPGRMVDGPNHLGYSYDSLGRVLAVVDKNNADRPLKEYVYDTAPGRGAGKLAQATRHNYVTLPWDAAETDAWVTDLYDYSGTAGAPSAKTTSFARGPYQYTSAFTYTDGGAIASVTYPTCDAGFACPGTPEPARTVSYTYEQGLLRQVPGWTNTITYHPSGAWNQMPRVNTVTDGRDSDPASPDRLNRFHASSPSTGASWDSGPMAYDGSGNLKSIGADKYTYDQSSRLLSGTAGGERQDYTYDAFGNITQIAHTDGGGGVTTRSIGVVPSTNRLSVATYDAAGNLTSWAGNTYTWDALGSLVQFNGGQNGGGTYLYDVEDRRVAVLKSPDNTEAAKDETYIVRSLAGQTLREFTVTGLDSPATRAWQKDYLYAAGNLLASVKTDGAGGEDIRHYHRDHLGSPRLITDASGSEVGRRTYLPYGEMVTDTASDETHKYTLHERDENFAGTDDDLDYMLARYYSPHLGRFLSCDPERGRAERLQTLNRYAYVSGNPLSRIDPTGSCEVILDDRGDFVGLEGKDCPQIDGSIKVTDEPDLLPELPRGGTTLPGSDGRSVDSCSDPFRYDYLRCREAGDYRDFRVRDEEFDNEQKNWGAMTQKQAAHILDRDQKALCKFQTMANSSSTEVALAMEHRGFINGVAATSPHFFDSNNARATRGSIEYDLPAGRRWAYEIHSHLTGSNSPSDADWEGSWDMQAVGFLYDVSEREWFAYQAIRPNPSGRSSLPAGFQASLGAFDPCG